MKLISKLNKNNFLLPNIKVCAVILFLINLLFFIGIIIILLKRQYLLTERMQLLQSTAQENKNVNSLSQLDKQINDLSALYQDIQTSNNDNKIIDLIKSTAEQANLEIKEINQKSANQIDVVATGKISNQLQFLNNLLLLLPTIFISYSNNKPNQIEAILSLPITESKKI